MFLVLFNSFCDILWRLVVVQFFFHKIPQFRAVHDFLALELRILSSDIGFVLRFCWVIFSVDLVFIVFIPDSVCAAAKGIADICIRTFFLP